MLIIAGTFTVDPDRRAEFLESRRESIGISRGEHGCLEYAMSADSVDPSLVRLFEMWSSQDDLQAHLQRIRSSMPAGGVPVLARNMKIYAGAKEQSFGA